MKIRGRKARTIFGKFYCVPRKSKKCHKTRKSAPRKKPHKIEKLPLFAAVIIKFQRFIFQDTWQIEEKNLQIKNVADILLDQKFPLREKMYWQERNLLTKCVFLFDFVYKTKNQANNAFLKNICIEPNLQGKPSDSYLYDKKVNY